MFNIKASREIDMPQEKVWELLSDATTPVEYHYMVKKVDLKSDHKVGVGAKRVCHFMDGTSINEEITEADDQRLKIVASGFSMPMLKEMYAILSATPSGSNSKTVVQFDVHFATKYGPLGYMMGSLMMKPMMNTIFKKVLAGIEERLMTGEMVKKGK